MIIHTEEYKTGIPAIDKQHAEYAELVNKLVSENKKGGMTKEAFCDDVNKVVAYALEHFDSEEFLMRSINYPLYEEHLAKHNIFRDRIDVILEEIDTKEINVDEYMEMLCKWLVDWFKVQILNDDIKLAKYIKENNIST